MMRRYEDELILWKSSRVSSAARVVKREVGEKEGRMDLGVGLCEIINFPPRHTSWRRQKKPAAIGTIPRATILIGEYPVD